MSKKKKKSKGNKIKSSDIWTEEEYADYMGFEFIAGYTSGGMPYGVMKEDEESSDDSKSALPIVDDDGIPF